MGLHDIQAPVASSSTLWAQATKEWVIPAKPKPGRKPKKEAASAILKEEEEEVDSKGRRVQNRAAQRAFRERKQSQLAELQARVQSYEQGEIERNVALQNISKRLKEENEVLRAENASLKDELERLKIERDRDREAQRERETERKNKRWREEDASIFLNPAHPVDGGSRKRYRPETSSPVARIPQQLSIMHSPPSLASSPDSNGGSIAPFSPLPFVAMPSTNMRPQSAFTNQVSLSASVPPSNYCTALFSRTNNPLNGPSINSSPFDPDCGLCSDESNCVCREFAIHQAQASLSGFSMQDQTQDLKVDLFDIVEQEQDRKPAVISIPPATLVNATNCRKTDGTIGDTSPLPAIPKSPTLQTPSILDNLPAYQPPVPLPSRRNAGNSHTSSRASNSKGSSSMCTLFQIRLPSPEPAPARSSPPTQTARRSNASSAPAPAAASSAAVCSGDPSNCMACKDDDFGKAFCRALGDSICSASPCATCPTNDSSRPSDRCCGGGKCGREAPCRPNADEMPNGEGITVISLTPANETDYPSNSSTIRSGSCQLDQSRGASASSSNSAPSNAATVLPSSSEGETIPTSDAWRQLKSHPNIAFADLSMLADVVARRTKCTGPTAVIHPPPGSLTPERFNSPGASSSGNSIRGDSAYLNKRVQPARLNSHAQGADNMPVLLTDPHARYHEQRRVRTDPSITTSATAGNEGASGSGSSSPPPSLVPQEELRQCGRARLREVDAAGVREALRILDAQFGRR